MPMRAARAPTQTGARAGHFLLRARLVVPIARPPIENGVVEVEDGRILLVDRWTSVMGHTVGRVIDLGEVILLPGLINAHCHLDYTRMAGLIPPPKGFVDWIQSMVALKSAWSYAEFAESWLAGASMLIRTGTTTVADIEAVPELLPEVWQSTPLRVVSFRELIHLQGWAAAESLVRQAAVQWAETGRQARAALPQADGRLGLSPHAPYSTTGDLLKHAAVEARARGWPLSTHLAESEEEFEMFRHGGGPLYRWLKSQRPMGDCGRASPVQHLENLGYLGGDLLAVHVNYLDRGDAAILARRQVHVVHCPRSHAYFQHKPFPRTELATAGVNLCLGTDSLATVHKLGSAVPTLSLFSEMAALAEQAPDLAPAEILRMATVNGARALGQEGRLGELSPGARADLVAIPYTSGLESALEGTVHYRGEVCASMVAGSWAVPPGGM